MHTFTIRDIKFEICSNESVYVTIGNWSVYLDNSTGEKIIQDIPKIDSFHKDKANILRKFLANHEDAFIYCEYEKIDEYSSYYHLTGSCELNGKTVTEDLFSIHGEKTELRKDLDLIFEIAGL